MIENGEKVFLATTALEEFWDKSRKVVFLGDWCCRYSKKETWSKLDYSIMPSVWLDDEKFEAATKYSNELCEKILISLTESLNLLHNKEGDVRYWRIIIANWVKVYTSIFFSRYCSIIEFRKAYGEFDTYVLSKEDYFTPNNLEDCFKIFAQEEGNLQITSNIFRYLGMNFPERKLSKVCEVQKNKPNIFNYLKKTRIKIFDRIITEMSRYSKVVMTYSYLPLSDDLRIFSKTKGKIGLVRTDSKEVILNNGNSNKRLNLKINFKPSNEFEEMLIQFIFEDIPKCYIENFENIENYCRKVFPSKPKAIFSATRWYPDEVFCIWAANMYLKGTKLLCFQHGGNYGIEKYTGNHEIAISDMFYTWGWDWNHKKIKPLVANILIGKSKVNPNNNYTDVLYANTGIWRYYTSFGFRINVCVEEYIEMQFSFLDELDEDVKKHIKIRPHYLDDGWDMRERIADRFPDLQIQHWDVSFYDSLRNCRIYICDHLSTTYIQALYCNKPTILFWKECWYDMYEDAKPYFQMLVDVGILHYSPQSAAMKLKEVYDDVEAWWNDQRIQEAVFKFCEKYAHVPDNYQEIITKELLEYCK